MSRQAYDLCARNVRMTLGTTTKIMGIVNVTPDSFSGDGGLALKDSKNALSACVRHGCRLLKQGADLIDVGGESTRPGALRISATEEMRRVIPVIRALCNHGPVSVDTYKTDVARAALDAGACMVNNIMGHRLSTAFLKMVRDYQAGVVVMHMRGTPATMQSKARYQNVVEEVIKELKISVEKCLGVGIKKDKIIIDPGIGFAKTDEHNLLLIHHLGKLGLLRCPILLGVSRKSFIGRILQKSSGERLIGTAAAVTAGIMAGAHIVRVHDVAAIKQTVEITDAILNAHD